MKWKNISVSRKSSMKRKRTIASLYFYMKNTVSVLISVGGLPFLLTYGYSKLIIIKVMSYWH